jgi:hypothetical protein
MMGLVVVFVVVLPGAGIAQPGVLKLVSHTREVSVQIDTVESYYESCVPMITPDCLPDSTSDASFPDHEEASGAGPFVASASRPEFPGTFAVQDSEIAGSSVRAAGSHEATSSFWNSGGFPITYLSESHDTNTRASVTFELDATSAYVLSGSVTTLGLMFSSSSSRIHLIGPGETVLAEVEVESDPTCTGESCLTVGPELLGVSGTLVPGVYTLEAIASGNAGGAHSTMGSFGSFQGGEFEVDLQLSAAVPALLEPWRIALALALLGTAFLSSLRAALSP